MSALSYIDSLPLGGFNYDNVIRNKAMLAAVANKGASAQLKTAKTGTTICGIVFKVSLPKSIANFCALRNRMELPSVPIPELLEAASLVTRTARRSITWLPTSDAVELELPLIATTSPVRKSATFE
jgi:hypothetical protein